MSVRSTNVGHSAALAFGCLLAALSTACAGVVASAFIGNWGWALFFAGLAVMAIGAVLYVMEILELRWAARFDDALDDALEALDLVHGVERLQLRIILQRALIAAVQTQAPIAAEDMDHDAIARIAEQTIDAIMALPPRSQP